MKLTMDDAIRKMMKDGGDLNIYNSDITVLPKNLVVPGDLTMMNAPVSRLPDGLIVRGSLWLTGCKKLSRLPENLYVGKNIWIKGTKITKIPESVNIGGIVCK